MLASPQLPSQYTGSRLNPCAQSTAFDAHKTMLNENVNGYFAFARVKGELRLVQVSSATPASALMTVDVKLFRHEFISIFRFSENCTLHPSDINIIEPIDEQLTRYEEENGTVFLARDLMERMRKLSDPRWTMALNTHNARSVRRSQMLRQRQR